jgi:hypothetical protein
VHTINADFLQDQILGDSLGTVVRVVALCGDFVSSSVVSWNLLHDAGGYGVDELVLL